MRMIPYSPDMNDDSQPSLFLDSPPPSPGVSNFLPPSPPNSRFQLPSYDSSGIISSN